VKNVFLLWKLTYTFKTWVWKVVWRDSTKKRVFSLFFVYILSPSIINYAYPNFQIHARWHFSMCLNSQQRFLQFHPTVMLVAYVNYCFIIIRQNFFLITPLVSSNSSWPKWFDYFVKYITSIKFIKLYYLKIIVRSNSCNPKLCFEAKKVLTNYIFLDLRVKALVFPDCSDTFGLHKLGIFIFVLFFLRKSKLIIGAKRIEKQNILVKVCSNVLF